MAKRKPKPWWKKLPVKLPAAFRRRPTVRGAKRRGYEPVNWHITRQAECRIVSGVIYHEEKKFLAFWSPSTEYRKVPRSERAHMKPL